MTRSKSLVRPIAIVTGYVRSSIEELGRVSWPTREQTTQYTVIVIVSVLVVTGLTAALDFGLSTLLEQVISWSQRV